MDEKKEERKKESIDEILSDLNSLLNKMPAILGDIELPSSKPAEPRPAPVQEVPRAQDAASAPESSRTVPEERAPVQEDAFERTVKLDPDRIPVSGGSVDRMVIQSLDEFTITPESLGMQDGQPALSEPLALPGEITGAGTGESGPLSEVYMPDADQRPSSPDGEGGTSYGPDHDGGRPQEAGAAGEIVPPESPFEKTVDFGIPDIDALLDLSASAVPDKAEVSGPVPEAVQPSGENPAPIASDTMEGTGLGDIIITPVGVEGGNMGGTGGDPDPQAEIERTARKVSGQEAAPSAPQAGEDTLIVLPGQAAGAEPVPEAAQSADEKTVVLPPQPEQPAGSEGLVLEPAVSIRPQPEESSLAVPPPGESTSETGAPALEQIQFAAFPEAEPAPVQPAEGLALAPAGPEPESQAASPSEPAAEERTVVIAPSQPDGERTVIFDGTASAAPASAPRDLGSLSVRTAPENVQPERIRNVAFIYAGGEESFCAEVLADLDAICLKSASSPMFIARSFVDVCDPGTNGNVVMQKVVDAKAAGLVCLGGVAQESVYEMENVFTAAGTFFRHLTRENYSRSAALDLVMEFILK